MIGRRAIGDVFRLFITFSLFNCVNAVLILAISSLVISESPFTAGVGFVMLPVLILFVYVIDRWDVTEEDRINNPIRTELATKYRRELLVVAVLAIVVYEGILATAFLAHGVEGVLYVLAGNVPLGVLYLYDRLKSLPFPHSTAVAAAWGFEIVFVFYFASPEAITTAGAGVLFLSWFLIVYGGLEGRNAEDIEGDREAGKLTMAIVLGERGTMYLEAASKITGAGLLGLYSSKAIVVGLVVVHLLSLRVYRAQESRLRLSEEADVPSA